MMLNPMMPAEVAVKPIAYQRLPTFIELFRFKQFNGIGLMRMLHMLGQVINAFIHIVFIMGIFYQDEAGVIVVSIIFLPLSLVLNATLIRVFSELIVSVLLIPSLLVKNQPAAGGPVMDDLASYDRPVGAHEMTGSAV